MMYLIVFVKLVFGVVKYFVKDDFVSGEYYIDEKVGDVSMWGGGGVVVVGFIGVVDKEVFVKVLSGELLFGEKVEVWEG